MSALGSRVILVAMINIPICLPFLAMAYFHYNSNNHHFLQLSK